MKFRSILAGALALVMSASFVFAQTNQGSSPLTIAKGGTNAITASAARTSLGVAIGSNVQAWDADLDCLAANSTAGVLAYTGAGTCAARTLTAPAAGFTITNPAGTAGNPTFVLANDLAAVEGLAANGMATRTATDTWAVRTITGTANAICVTNGDGVSGNPMLDICSGFLSTAHSWAGVQTFTNPIVGTQSPGDNSTKAASTAYADAIAALKVNLTRNVSTGCGLAGGGDLSADRTLRVSFTINAQTGTSYTVLDGDCGKLVSLSNAASVAVTLPQANGSTFISGWTVDFVNKGVGTVTITPTTSTINGGANLVLTTNQGAHCDSDAANYTCVLGVGTGGGGGITSIVCDGVTITTSGTCPPRYGYVNCTLAASAASSALTVALKNNAGSDPSSSSPCTLNFRNVTSATGTWTQVIVTSAQSLVISSGSTMGVTSATAFRIWIVGFNDTGTFRLGAINCSTSTTIFPLNEGVPATSIAEGGAGAADSAGVIYTGTAVSSKSFLILGYIEWNTTGVTAGTWTTTNLNFIQSMGPGIRKPGEEIQRFSNIPGTVSTTTTAVPQDDTIPQITEGKEFLNITITPTSAVNFIEVASHLFGACSAVDTVTVAIFRDATANALAAVSATSSTNLMQIQSIFFMQQAGSAASTTYRVRAGPSAGTTTYTFNGQAGGRLYGGVGASSMFLREIMG